MGSKNCCSCRDVGLFSVCPCCGIGALDDQPQSGLRGTRLHRKQTLCQVLCWLQPTFWSTQPCPCNCHTEMNTCFGTHIFEGRQRHSGQLWEVKEGSMEEVIVLSASGRLSTPLRSRAQLSLEQNDLYAAPGKCQGHF